MSVNSAKFAELLTKAVRQIHIRENKPLSIIQDELGQAVGKSGSSAIEHWRKGNVPRPPTLMKLTEQIVKRGGLSDTEVQAFLRYGGISSSESKSLCQQMFGQPEQTPPEFQSVDGYDQYDIGNQKADSAQRTRQSEMPNLPSSGFIQNINRVRSAGFAFAAIFGVSVLTLFLVSVNRLNTNASALRNGAMKLVTSGDRYVVVTHNGQPLESGATIRAHEPITVSFRLMNVDTQTIMLEKIVMGSRGPNANCALEAQKWDASNDVPFNAKQSQTLMPGEIYEYRDTRSFFERGRYFIEPLIEDASGKWHGVSPFTCVDVIVE